MEKKKMAKVVAHIKLKMSQTEWVFNISNKEDAPK